jgi:hypothetical protein
MVTFAANRPWLEARREDLRRCSSLAIAAIRTDGPSPQRDGGADRDETRSNLLV